MTWRGWRSAVDLPLALAKRVLGAPSVRVWRPVIGFLLMLLALAALALFREQLGVSLFYIALLTTLFFWIAQATSWNILSGFSGYFSFGQGAFVGVGIYTTAVLTAKHGWSFYLTLPVAAVLSTLLALGIGAVAFRLGSFRGATFALLTLAVPFILLAGARLTRAIDGGQGIVVPVPELPGDLRFQEFHYLVTLVVAVGAVAVAYGILHSRFGWALFAIHDNEDVAEQLGVATFRWKMLAIAATGFIGGLGGGAWALQLGYVTVENVFTLTIPLFVIVMSVLGGRTHWLGPVIGASVIVLMQDRLAGGAFEHMRLIIFGGLLALMVIFAPTGLWGGPWARPWFPLTTAVVAFVAFTLAGSGDLLDRVGLAMLVVALVAFWPHRFVPRSLVPQRLLPPWLRSRMPDTPPPAAGPQAAAPPATAHVPGGNAPAGAVDGAGGRGLRVGATAGQVVIECRDVARYFGGVRALDGVDLQITQGELVGLVGPNGSGKTTLVNLLTGGLRPTRGTIRVAGRDTAGLAPHTFTHVGIARTYQIPRPFESMTVRDNVAMALLFGRQPRRLADARSQAIEHLEFVGLDRLAGAHPSDINLHQRQLLEMARALATSPKVLLLDEALAGLNPAEIDNAVEVVRRIHDAGVTIVIVEHLLRVVNQLASRVVVLNRGQLLADGDPRTVMSDPEVVRAYLGKSGRAAQPTEAATGGEGGDA
jgi:branched-chain amino acid transport system permease protein